MTRWTFPNGPKPHRDAPGGRWLRLSVLLAALLQPGQAFADEHDVTIPPGGLAPGTLTGSISVRASQGSARYLWPASGLRTSDDVSQLGLELRAQYWKWRGLGLDLHLGRPEIDDRMGHAEDWTTDRLRTTAVLAVAEGPLMLRANLGVSVPIFAYESLPGSVGAGASVVAGFQLEAGPTLLGFGYAGRTGTKGDQAGIGTGIVLRSARHALAGSLRWSHTAAQGEVARHGLFGGQLTYTFAHGDRLSLLASAGGFGSPQAYGIGSGAAVSLSLREVSAGVQSRF
jgi:hypothetical protein